MGGMENFIDGLALPPDTLHSVAYSPCCAPWTSPSAYTLENGSRLLFVSSHALTTVSVLPSQTQLQSLVLYGYSVLGPELHKRGEFSFLYKTLASLDSAASSSHLREIVFSLSQSYSSKDIPSLKTQNYIAALDSLLTSPRFRHLMHLELVWDRAPLDALQADGYRQLTFEAVEMLLPFCAARGLLTMSYAFISDGGLPKLGKYIKHV